jgi:hypothetical protein
MQKNAVKDELCQWVLRAYLFVARIARWSGPSMGCFTNGSAVLNTERRMKSLRFSCPVPSHSTCVSYIECVCVKKKKVGLDAYHCVVCHQTVPA